MQDKSLSIPVLSLITLMIPAAILLLFFSSLFCVFLLVSCGLSTININNLGNCLLLLKSIPVLLLLSAGPGPKSCYDGDQTKETKWNENRGKQAPHPSAPCEFRWGCSKPKKHFTRFQLKSLFSIGLPYMCYHPGAGRIWLQCKSPTRSIPQGKAAQTLAKGTDLVGNPSPCASAAAHLMKTVKNQNACAKIMMKCLFLSAIKPPSLCQSPSPRTTPTSCSRCCPDGDSFPCQWQRKKSTMCLEAQAGGTKFFSFPSLAYTATLLRASCGETLNSKGHRLCLGDTFYICNPRTLLALWGREINNKIMKTVI